MAKLGERLKVCDKPMKPRTAVPTAARLVARDIDYAAVAVKAAIAEKFGRHNELQDLNVSAGEKTIVVAHNGKTIEGTRDDLLALIRKAENYAELWDRKSRR